jgi:type IV secretory pathway VirB6-like protein
VSVEIQVVVFRVMALCIVVYCYAASTLMEYSLPKCWYPPVKVRCTDTIGYLQFLSLVTCYNIIKSRFLCPVWLFLLITSKKTEEILRTFV